MLELPRVIAPQNGDLATFTLVLSKPRNYYIIEYNKSYYNILTGCQKTLATYFYLDFSS